MDDWDGPPNLVESSYRNYTHVTYPLLTYGSMTATAWGVYNQGIILDAEGIVRFVTNTHQLPYQAMQDTIETYLALINAPPPAVTVKWTGTTLDLNWLTLPNIQSYEVYESDHSNFMSESLIGTTISNTFSISDALVNRKYYRVKAVYP